MICNCGRCGPLFGCLKGFDLDKKIIAQFNAVTIPVGIGNGVCSRCSWKLKITVLPLKSGLRPRIALEGWWLVALTKNTFASLWLGYQLHLFLG